MTDPRRPLPRFITLYFQPPPSSFIFSGPLFSRIPLFGFFSFFALLTCSASFHFALPFLRTLHFHPYFSRLFTFWLTLLFFAASISWPAFCCPSSLPRFITLFSPPPPCTFTIFRGNFSRLSLFRVLLFGSTHLTPPAPSPPLFSSCPTLLCTSCFSPFFSILTFPRLVSVGVSPHCRCSLNCWWNPECWGQSFRTWCCCRMGRNRYTEARRSTPRERGALELLSRIGNWMRYAESFIYQLNSAIARSQRPRWPQERTYVPTSQRNISALQGPFLYRRLRSERGIFFSSIMIDLSRIMEGYIRALAFPPSKIKEMAFSTRPLLILAVTLNGFLTALSIPFSSRWF